VLATFGKLLYDLFGLPHHISTDERNGVTSVRVGSKALCEWLSGIGFTKEIVPDIILTAPRDGLTVLMSVNGLVTELPHTLKPKYDPLKDLKPLVEVAGGGLVPDDVVVGISNTFGYFYQWDAVKYELLALDEVGDAVRNAELRQRRAVARLGDAVDADDGLEHLTHLHGTARRRHQVRADVRKNRVAHALLQQQHDVGPNARRGPRGTIDRVPAALCHHHAQRAVDGARRRGGEQLIERGERR